MILLLYFIAGAVFGLVFLISGITLAFFIATRASHLNVEKFEERVKKTDIPYRTETKQAGGGPVRMKTPQKIDIDKEPGLYDKIRSIAGL